MTQPPDPDNLPIDPADCDDTPKLTAEEWEYIAEMSRQDDDEERNR